MKKRSAAVLLTSALVLGGGAYAYASDSPARPQVGASATASTPAKAKMGKAAKGLLARTVHGDLVVRQKGGTFGTVTIDRGTVQGDVTPGPDATITLVRPDGVTVTKHFTADTKVNGAGADGIINKGRPAIVVSSGDNAVRVVQRPKS